jgi:hypothetical protein
VWTIHSPDGKVVETQRWHLGERVP